MVMQVRLILCLMTTAVRQTDPSTSSTTACGSASLRLNHFACGDFFVPRDRESLCSFFADGQIDGAKLGCSRSDQPLRTILLLPLP
jgi:hypothetical protein